MKIEDVAIKEIMTTHTISVHVDDPFNEVEEKMRIHHIRHIPVVNHQDKLVGMITQTDLFRAVSPRKTEDGFVYDPAQLNSFILKFYMTPEPLTLGPDNFISEAIDMMLTHKFGAIPIVDFDKSLLGIVTQIDLLKFFSKHLHVD